MSPEIDSIIFNINENGSFEDNEVFFFAKDHLGSVHALTNKQGTPVQRYSYSAYGKTKVVKLDGSDKMIKNPYGYTVREWEEETGDYYYRARYYNPRTGRFLSEDPIGFRGGDTNLYRYVQNDPISWADSFGDSRNRLIKDPSQDNWRPNDFGSGGTGPITGYTRHGINNAISRDGKGVSLRSILDTVKNPITVTPQPNGSTRYVGPNSTVVLNPDGKIITTWPTNSSGQRCGE